MGHPKEIADIYNATAQNDLATIQAGIPALYDIAENLLARIKNDLHWEHLPPHPENYLFSHVLNVCWLSLGTGYILGYGPEHLVPLGAGALLHDIGMMRLPIRVAENPARLSPPEYEIVKTHPVLGEEIIRKVMNGASKLPGTIALQHHETYDGTGYPKKLSGEDMAEFAQIVAISDKYDALTQARAYRPAFDDTVVQCLCKQSGNIWVAKPVLNAFVEYMERGKYSC